MPIIIDPNELARALIAAGADVAEGDSVVVTDSNNENPTTVTLGKPT
jgi:hypothetical protein